MKTLSLSLFLLCITIFVATFANALGVDENGVPLADGPAPAGVFPTTEDLVQTVGPEIIRDYQPSSDVVFTHAVFMAENNCKLRNQFRGARAFLHLEAGFYPTLDTKLLAGKPRIKFFELESDFKTAVVAPSQLSQADLLQMLNNIQKDPNFYAPKGKVVELFISRETSSDELIDLFERFNIERAFEFDIAKRPDIHETSEDRTLGQFSYDDELRQLNPTHDKAVPHPDYDYDAVLKKADEEVAAYREKQYQEMEEAEALLNANKPKPIQEPATESASEAPAAPKKDEL